MKLLVLVSNLHRRMIALVVIVFMAASSITSQLNAQTEIPLQDVVSTVRPDRVSEDRDAMLARLIKILKYGGDHSGLGKPTKVDAVIALGLLGDERVVSILAEHLVNEENNSLRLQIVRALGWIGSSQAVPALEQTLQDKYPLLRKQAADVLKAITGRDYEYDKTGLPDYTKMRELIQSAVKGSPSEGVQGGAP